MPLPCSCDFEPEFGMWQVEYWRTDYVVDFKPFLGERRKRCCSCNELINIGAMSIEFPRVRYPNNAIEAKIYGRDPDGCDWEEPWIRMAPIYHCEKCGEIFLNLNSLGFECLKPVENMPEMLKEYIAIYDPQPLIGESKKQKLERIKNRPAKKYGLRAKETSNENQILWKTQR